jgi:hypothetical protein
MPGKPVAQIRQRRSTSSVPVVPARMKNVVKIRGLSSGMFPNQLQFFPTVLCASSSSWLFWLSWLSCLCAVSYRMFYTNGLRDGNNVARRFLQVGRDCHNILWPPVHSIMDPLCLQLHIIVPILPHPMGITNLMAQIKKLIQDTPAERIRILPRSLEPEASPQTTEQAGHSGIYCIPGRFSE